jgi:hypothetical protein
MMADWAWSPIIADDGTRIKVGEKVTAEKLGVDDEEYQRIKDAGAIRERKHPDDVGPFESVRERNVRVLAQKLAEAQEENYDVPLTVETADQESETPSAKDAKEVKKGQ